MDTEKPTADATLTDDNTNPPAPNHNHPPPSEAQRLLAEARKSLQAHSRHSKGAIDKLRDFLVHVMERCEFAEESAENAKEVRLELLEAGVHAPAGKSWLGPLVNASFHSEAEREAEKTNVSKWVSVLCYARRANIKASGLKEWLERPENTIAALARKEAKARQAERDPATVAARTATRDRALNDVLAKHRQPIELPGVHLADGARFTVLVIERSDGGLCCVAQATPTIEQVRGYFGDELKGRAS